jgi:hypothetical protein
VYITHSVTELNRIKSQNSTQIPFQNSTHQMVQSTDLDKTSFDLVPRWPAGSWMVGGVRGWSLVGNITGFQADSVGGRQRNVRGERESGV